jgi:hypothetical protein
MRSRTASEPNAPTTASTLACSARSGSGGTGCPRPAGAAPSAPTFRRARPCRGAPHRCRPGAAEFALRAPSRPHARDPVCPTTT